MQDPHHRQCQWLSRLLPTAPRRSLCDNWSESLKCRSHLFLWSWAPTRFSATHHLPINHHIVDVSPGQGRHARWTPWFPMVAIVSHRKAVYPIAHNTGIDASTSKIYSFSSSTIHPLPKNCSAHSLRGGLLEGVAVVLERACDSPSMEAVKCCGKT